MRSRFTYTPAPPPRAAPSKPAQIYGFVFLLLGALIFAQTLADRFGVTYLPARDWVSAVTPAAQIGGLTFAALTFFAFWHLGSINRQNGEGFTRKKLTLLLIAGPFFFYFIVIEVIVTSVPMVVAAVIGTDVTHRFVVSGTDVTNKSDCRDRIVLADMPFMTREICGYPAETVGKFSAGDTLAATGRGTSMGLYPQHISGAQ